MLPPEDKGSSTGQKIMEKLFKLFCSEIEILEKDAKIPRDEYCRIIRSVAFSFYVVTMSYSFSDVPREDAKIIISEMVIEVHSGLHKVLNTLSEFKDKITLET